MSEMTSRERFTRMFQHSEADRIPIVAGPWGATIERWRREGLPEEVPYEEYFGLDRTAMIHIDNSPRYPTEVLEETEDYTITRTAWGATLKNWKHIASTPEFMDFIVHDRPSWEEAKKRMQPTRDRINWKQLEENYPKWREEGRWIWGHGWFGFDITHSWFVGTECILMALAQDPEWCRDMFQHELELNLKLLEMAWEEGYTFDCLRWPDDMGYKHHQFFSMGTYRDLLKPVHKRAVEWAHARGAKAELHSCGDINPFVPELVEIGLDGLNPLEVKAGMDPLDLKENYGNDLVLHGGINAVLWDDTEAITAEMRRLLPRLKENGGYIFSSDHSVPSAVSLEDFRHIISLARELGTY